MGFPGGSDGKESACNAEGLALISGLERPSRGGHDNPLYYSCLEKPCGQRSLAVHGVAKSWTQLSNYAHTHTHTHTHTHIYIYIAKSYSAIKKNEIMSSTAMWMDLEIIILSEVSQKEKGK